MTIPVLPEAPVDVVRPGIGGNVDSGFGSVSVQRRMALPTMGFVLLLLVVVLVVGKKVGGAQRWLTLGPFSFQPSELAKYVLIMYVARVLAANSHRPESLVHTYLPNVIMMGIVFGLVMLQPDLGTAVVLVASAGLNTAYCRRSMAIPGAHGRRDVAIPLVQIVFRRLQPRPCVGLPPAMEGPARYRLSDRPGSQGSRERRLGRRWLGQSQQKLFYLPESHTDFIFAIIGEEMGLIGTFALIALFVVLLWRILNIAVKCNEPFGSYLGLGIFISLALQVTMNLGVVSGLLPTKGMPLPFISHGGSNLLFSMLAVGTMLSIAGRKT